MNQFKDIFLGLSKPDYRRVVNSQKCLRVSGKHNDLEQVGKDTYHHTFFEMLGNWSFDDYFKPEAIQWAWELLTEVWGINPDQLWATVFAGDTEDGSPADTDSKQLWPKVTSIPQQRVLLGGRKDNFWEMGDIGPCGPCSEIHIDLGPDSCDMKNVPGHKCAVNGGCSRFIELWNLVFIQYNRTEDGKLAELGARYVDTGAGLERIVAVLQKKKSNYDTDLFMSIIETISQITGKKYSGSLGGKTDIAFRVVADHLRSLVFAITDGATPSNEGRGYVLRRILRRASRFGRVLNMHDPFIFDLVPTVVDLMGDFYNELHVKRELVQNVIESEEFSFGRTLDRGIEIFNVAAEKAQSSKDRTINGDDAFMMYDTYGFPLDLTQLMARENGLEVDTAGFDNLMEQQRERARAAQKTSSFVPLVTNTKLPDTDDSLKYKGDRCVSRVFGWITSDGTHISSGVLNEFEGEVGLILKRTCFYAESGGQVGDTGKIESPNGEFIVENTEKIGDCIIHRGRMKFGTLKVHEQVNAVVDKDRDSIKKNHTATHLLQLALQQVLGKSVSQQGSLVCPDYLRFDFTYPEALTSERIKKVERLVRERITEDLAVTCAVMPREEAEKLGAMALFGEKYGNEVRVVAIGAKIADSGQRIADRKKKLYAKRYTLNAIKEAVSCEFCGGTHVDKIGSIGGFKIIKQESISAGVRRITALTGPGLADYLQRRSDIVDKLSATLKVPAEDVIGRVEKLIKDNKKLSKQLKSGSKKTGSDTMAEAKQFLKTSEKIGQTSVVIGRLSATSAEQARAAIDMLKKKAKSTAVVFGFADDDKATLIAGVTDDLVKKGLKAGDIVGQIAPIVNGGGGGRPQLAQAGGKKPKKIEDALNKARELIKEKLTNA